MAIGDDPQRAPGTQNGPRPADEGLAQSMIFGPAIVEGRIADHEVETFQHRLAANVGPVKAHARILNIALGRVDGAAVDVDQLKLGDGRGFQRLQGDHAHAAAKIGAVAFQGGQGGHQKRGSLIQPIPAEHAGLAPQAKAWNLYRRARCDRFFQTGQAFSLGGETDAVVALAGFFKVAAERRQLLGQARAALILGRKHHQGSAVLQSPQRKGDGAAALHRSGRGRQDDRGQAFWRHIGQIRRSGKKRRDLHRLGPIIDQFQRGRAVNANVEGGVQRGDLGGDRAENDVCKGHSRGVRRKSSGARFLNSPLPC